MVYQLCRQTGTYYPRLWGRRRCQQRREEELDAETGVMLYKMYVLYDNGLVHSLPSWRHLFGRLAMMVWVCSIVLFAADDLAGRWWSCRVLELIMFDGNIDIQFYTIT